ncbi:MAG: thioesterase family protein, partial [Actinomycetota bacterium]
MSRFDFDTDTEVHALGGGRYRGQLHSRWTIEDVLNGGYVMGLMLRATARESSQPDPLTTTAHFLSPTRPGPVEITVEILKAGRSTSTLMTSLLQEGRERIRALTTAGSLDERVGPDHMFLRPPAIDPPFEERRSLLVQKFPENFRFQVPVSVAGGALGRPSGKPEMGGTIAFADDRPPDLLSLPVFA